MNYKQKDYYISEKENEYYKVLNVVDYMLEEAKSNNKYPIWGEKLKTEWAATILLHGILIQK